MHEILNNGLSGDTELMTRINSIANRLLRDVPADDSTNGAQQRALLERALAYAAEAEQKLADRDQRIAYLQDLSLTDELTGLLNRRGFIQAFGRALAGARRYGHEGMLLYCDLDDFKSMNDIHGHAAGDELLRHIARVLGDSVRAIDIVGRLGGDEFAIALLQSSWRNGSKRARTVQYQLENSDFAIDGKLIPLRISIGCEPFGPDDQIDDLICRADMTNRAEPASRVAAE